MQDKFPVKYTLNGKTLSEEEFIEHQKKQTLARWFECPASGGAKRTPMACMFCPFGHMLHCHWPYVCSDPKAKCSKYEEIEENEEWY